LAIARQYGVTVQAIQDANGITNPRGLLPNQEIIIPVEVTNEEPTIVPTPTPIALDIRGLAFHRTPQGTLWSLGEVVNLSAEPAEEVQVQVSLHDGEGQLLAVGSAFSQLDILAGGGRAPFAILFSAPPTSFAQYQTRVLRGVPSTHLGPRYNGLEIVENWGGWEDETIYEVRGVVQNSGKADAEQVLVIVTLYDGEGHVVGARTLGISAELFLAGARAPFEVSIVPMGSVTRYDVQVQGWRVGYEVPAATGTATLEATPGATP
jgi:LysM repeat protein